MISSNAASGIIAGRAPSSRDRVGLAGRLQPGDQVAEPLGAADPGGVHERGQPQQLRAVGQPGRAQPGGVQPGQARSRRPARVISGFVRFRRPGSVPPQTSPVPANRAAASSRAW